MFRDKILWNYWNAFWAWAKPSIWLTLAHSCALSGSLCLTLVLSGSLWISPWLTLTHSGSVWLTLALTLALSGALRFTTSLLGSLRRSCETAVNHALLWWRAWTNNTPPFIKWDAIKTYKIFIQWQSLFWNILSFVYLCKALAKCNMTFLEAQFSVHRSLHQLETKFRQKGIDK